jgi:hypothetical protein
VKNHPFVDGNKRTGLVAALVFLTLNGYEFRAPEEDLTRIGREGYIPDGSAFPVPVTEGKVFDNQRDFCSH